MNLFEGNQQILNLYSQIDKPQNFFYIVVVLFVILLVFIAITVGMAGYLAFGDTAQSLLIYNLPSNDPLSIAAKVFYIVTITGSYVILIQPIFHVVESSSWYLSIMESMGSYSPMQHSSGTSSGHLSMRSQGSPQGEQGEQREKPVYQETWSQSFFFYLFRTAFVMFILVCSFYTPSLNIMLAIGGAILGTIVTVVIPVMFYNKAYADEEVNHGKDKSTAESKSNRKFLRRFNYLIMTMGISVSMVGFVNTIKNIMNGVELEE